MPNDELKLTTTQAGALAQPSPAELLRAVIQGGVTQENVATVEKIMDMAERMEKRQAEKEFAEAFLTLQKELPVIQGTRQVADRFVYANFEDLDAIIRPICLRNGFTYAFRESAAESGSFTVTMDLTHRGGHSRPIPCTVRAGRGPTGCNESQADMSAHEYAKRGALEQGLCLRILNKRSNAAVEGGPVTPDQAFNLERRVKESNSDVAKFLAFAGAKTFAEIKSERYDELDRYLRKKEGLSK